MGEDPEKRFHSIMDKLFHSPKSVSSSSRSSGGQLLSGKKRPNPESALALVKPRTQRDVTEGSQHSSALAEAPLCRPWDRGDLMRRLATFKSMTWFGKPKVISAVNCARRGWINVDMDIIACEACGARLLFSSPSSWTQQQVEKAAMVFSLKLDNGHKLLCPWIDNACDERLAEFPPIPAPVLADKFKERCSALSQLLALPVISSSATDYMRSPQLEEFLRQSPILEYGNGSADISQIEFLENESEADCAKSYYQAQKIISLCGWEPRSLPYIVDCKDRTKQRVEATDILKSSRVVTDGQNPNINVHSVASDDRMGANEDCGSLNGPLADPNSCVLDCRLCGASVGLWTFSTVPRPLELVRLAGQTEVNSRKNTEQNLDNENQDDDRESVLNCAPNGTLSFADGPSSLTWTIAGGPLPTKQNFKAKISLPVIGRNLRARFSYDSDFRDRTLNNQEFSEEFSQRGAVGLLRSITHDEGQCSHASGDQSSCLNPENSEQGNALRMEANAMSFEETDVTTQRTLPETGMPGSVTECPMQSTPDILQGFDFSDGLLENRHDIESFDSALGVFGSSQVASVPDPDANVTVGNAKSIENESSMMNTSDNGNHHQIQGADAFSEVQNLPGAQAKSHEGIKGGVQIPGNSEALADGTGKDQKQESFDKEMKFDPIRQHRHFCPWIVSPNGGSPGWQQTLSALQRQTEHFRPSPTSSLSPASMIKVDDPITAIRKLFRSPSAKKMKASGGSS